MCSALNDPAVCDDEDLRGVPNGVQPMGDHDDGLVLRQCFDCLLQPILVLRIDVRCRLVKDDDGRVLENGTGDGDALLFAARKVCATLADHCFIPVRQSRDEIMTRCLFCCRNDLCAARLWSSETNVIFDGVVEEVDTLKDNANLCHQGCKRIFLDIVSADGNCAGIDIPEPRNEMAQCCLTGAARSDNRRQTAFGDLCGNVAEERSFSVGKG